MKKIVCQYAVVRFMPMIETEEFINIGVILLAPQQRFFGFKLVTKRVGRIRHMFGKKVRDTYRFARKAILEKELSGFKEILQKYWQENCSDIKASDFAKRQFSEFIRPRETMIRFSESKVILSEDEEKALNEIFQFYVERELK
ncbi:Protein of unknown function (DUF3037) [Beggiatoa alba B18LD]|uniref:DUF3037 domain-containing protein n=1 Tax=Beggiatoa alba B18LD TaxID=395493 RepID=I3CC93_9GAMM|nr:DUF3037 domain-containing protein [Beggiatoa alba]EIJ41236.1 Protein of unknown function (DUF3037) [Beggiatoa alba B18LD]